jgi:hypothetical protein
MDFRFRRSTRLGPLRFKVGMFPNHSAITRLVGSQLLEH